MAVEVRCHARRESGVTPSQSGSDIRGEPLKLLALPGERQRVNAGAGELLAEPAGKPVDLVKDYRIGRL